MPTRPEPERISADDQETLATLADTVDAANDRAADAQLALARFQRALAIKHELRDDDKCDRFGYLTRTVRPE